MEHGIREATRETYHHFVTFLANRMETYLIDALFDLVDDYFENNPAGLNALVANGSDTIAILPIELTGVEEQEVARSILAGRNGMARYPNRRGPTRMPFGQWISQMVATSNIDLLDVWFVEFCMNVEYSIRAYLSDPAARPVSIIPAFR